MTYPELTTLNALRLERDLTYRELAAEIGLPLRTIYSLLTRPGPRPYDRTLYKIRSFLDRQQSDAARNGARRRRGAVAR